MTEHAYRLDSPAVAHELNRLDLQHKLLHAASGGYPSRLVEVLKDTSGEKKCLDIGAGSGSWLLDAAKDFPESSFVGIDLAPIQPSLLPKNASWEIHDINQGLQPFYNKFDAVHARLIGHGIPDFAVLIDEISRVLKPGGVIDILEYDFQTYDENKTRVAPDVPGWSHYLAKARTAIKNRGGSPEAGELIHSLIDKHDAFKNVVNQTFWIPMSPSIDGDASGRDNFLRVIKSARGVYVADGLSEEEINGLESEARTQLTEGKVLQYSLFYHVHAVKV
ncbi:S-adenosyl-L-methionine-dependent methyltransferase [Hymenopellis radicata]|nr:S-adenosyl-L-methionine-dependent methyltransferase [Hymenopellis radicata]